MSEQPILQLTDLGKVFGQEKNGGTVAVKNVSLDLKRGEFIAIVGPSGCGKSTLLKMVAGLLSPTMGTISLKGKTIAGPQKEIGMVFQQPAPFPWLSAIDNIIFSLELRGVPKAQRAAQARRLLSLVGLSSAERSYLKQLSGGMKQRVAIAMALAANPDVLLMDEPFSALDTQTRELMQELVLSIWEETKKTVLFVTHDIDEAIFLADRVYVMSAKPGEIKDIMAVPLSRPRNYATKHTEEYLRLKKHISYVIRGEAIKAAQVTAGVIRPKALKIGLHVWPGNTLFYLGEMERHYHARHVDVECVSLEKEEDRFAALKNGEIDVLNLTAEQVLLAKEQGIDLKIFLCLNESSGADALVARGGIRKIDDLRGRRVGVERRWTGHFFLLYLLSLRGLTERDIEIVPMKASDIGAALIAKKIDAGVLWEPWLNQTTQLVDTTIIASTKEHPVLVDVLAATPETLKRKRALIESMVFSWFDALASLQQDRNEALTTMAIPLGVTKKQIEQQLRTITFLDQEQNRECLGQGARIRRLLEDAQEVLSANGKLSQKRDCSSLVDSTFVTKNASVPIRKKM